MSIKKFIYYFAAVLLCTSVICASPVDEDIRVTLHFENTPIAAVLKMLAAQNDLNLVVSDGVDGKISVNLDDVSLKAALDAILLPNNFDYYINDDIIIVKTINTTVSGQLIPRVYHLKYIDAPSALAAVAVVKSDKGSAKMLAPDIDINPGVAERNPASSLFIYDYPEYHNVIAALIDRIDVKKRQISVEVKIIETNLNKNETLGINWPKSISTSINGVPSPDAGVTGDALTDAAVMPLENGTWQLGNLSVHQLNIVLDFLEQRGNSKLLSNPRLTALDNETASIEIETVIPIQTINRFSEGAVIQDIVTFQDEKVGISLKVTPRINEENIITLKVNPTVEEIIGYTGPEDNQKPITSERNINTSVTVKDGETVVIGGLLKETEFSTESRVFLLGHIPLLGELFTHHRTESGTTDLMIMITPRILED